METGPYQIGCQCKGSAVDNYGPISCLPLAEKMYSHLERENTIPPEQKGCCKGSHGTKDQLLIEKTVLRELKGDTLI